MGGPAAWGDTGLEPGGNRVSDYEEMYTVKRLNFTFKTTIT